MHAYVTGPEEAWAWVIARAPAINVASAAMILLDILPSIFHGRACPTFAFFRLKSRAPTRALKQELIAFDQSAECEQADGAYHRKNPQRKILFFHDKLLNTRTAVEIRAKGRKKSGRTAWA